MNTSMKIYMYVDTYEYNECIQDNDMMQNVYYIMIYV
jgi:hypothetical protein